MLFLCSSDGTEATQAVVSQIKLRLYRAEEKRDVEQAMTMQKDVAAGGIIYSTTAGSYSSGHTELLLGNDVYSELGLNLRDTNGKVLGRRRLISCHSTEHLKWITVFRERPGAQQIDTPHPHIPEDIHDSDVVGPTTEADISSLCGKWRIERDIYDIKNGSVITRSEACVESRTLNDRRMIFENDGETGSGYGDISKDGRSMIVQIEGRATRRMVLFPGGVSAVYSVSVPKHSEDYYTELAWFVRPGERHVICRRFEGITWAGVTFSIEKLL